MTKKLLYMVLGGILTLGITFGAVATFAQVTDNGDADTTEAAPQFGPFGDRDQRRGHDVDFDKGQALADALGITVEELQAAHETARESLLQQAVDEGLITQEDADAILAGERPENGREVMAALKQLDREAALAEALGISVEELEAAQNEVFEAKLTAMVEAGVITEEQADAMRARRAVEERLDREAMQSAVQAVVEEAIDQALADGAITQEQADLLRQQLEEGAFLGGPGFGKHGPRGGHGPGHGGRRGFGPRDGANFDAPVFGSDAADA